MKKEDDMKIVRKPDVGESDEWDEDSVVKKGNETAWESLDGWMN